MKIIVRYSNYEDYQLERSFDDWNDAVAFAASVNGTFEQSED